MTPADYILGVLGFGLCLVWIAFSAMLACEPMFDPVPSARTYRVQRRGLISLVLAVLAMLWIACAMAFGEWGWLA